MSQVGDARQLPKGAWHDNIIKDHLQEELGLLVTSVHLQPSYVVALAQPALQLWSPAACCRLVDVHQAMVQSQHVLLGFARTSGSVPQDQLVDGDAVSIVSQEACIMICMEQHPDHRVKPFELQLYHLPICDRYQSSLRAQ